MSFDADVRLDSDDGSSSPRAPSPTAGPADRAGDAAYAVGQERLRVLMDNMGGELHRLTMAVNHIEHAMAEPGVTLQRVEGMAQRAEALHLVLRDRLEQLKQFRLDFPEVQNLPVNRIRLKKLLKDVHETTARFRGSVAAIERLQDQRLLGFELDALEPDAAPRTSQRQTQRQLLQPLPTLGSEHPADLLHLEHELEQLAQTFEDLNRVIAEQAPAVDHIEGNIQQTRESVRGAVKELSTAAKMQMAAVPIIGAVVGGLLGGPLGMVAGAQGAALLGSVIVGGAIGYGAAQQLSSSKTAAADKQERSARGGDA